MKKLALASLGITAAIIAIANIGSIAALALSAAAVFFGLHYVRKSESGFVRVLAGFVLVFGILSGISNIPAFIGLLAAAGAYYAWRTWKKEKRADDPIIDADPFTKFEKQWNEFTK